MQPADVGRLVDVSDPRVSPDGRWVAFVVTTVDLDENEYRTKVWLVPTDGREQARPVTRGDCRDLRPRWSPDGRQLAFVSHREDEGSQLLVLPVRGGGEVQPVASWPEEIEDVAWSPDGSRIAFTARDREEERYGKKRAKDQPPRRIDHLFYKRDSVGWTVDRHRHVFVVDMVGGGKPVPVTSGPYEDGGLAWSPDGKELLFSAGRHEGWDLDRAVDLFSVTVPSGADELAQPERLTPTGVAYAVPSWSPDSARIAYMQFDPQIGPSHGQVGVLDLASGERRLLTTSLDRNCFPYITLSREPIWDGDDLVFGADEGGNVHLYRVAADGSGKPELLVGGERWVSGWDAAMGVVAFCAGTPTSQSELFVLAGDGTERQLTSLGEAFTEQVALSVPERFTAVSADGTEVDAWVMAPVGHQPGSGQKYPTLLNIHGGPFTQYGNRFFDEFQVQAAAGYAVVFSNPRGSSGSTEAWGRAIRGPKAEVDPGTGWGGADYEDLMAVTDEAVRRFDFVDGDRLGVLGGSYGGYMTTWMLGHTTRFKAGVSERAVNNLLTMEHTSDIATTFVSDVGATHLDDPDEFRRQSPITYVRDIETPVLILHSEDDLRCPVEQAEELYVALRLLGKPVEFVRFPGESHELTRSGAPQHRVARFEIILDYLARHL
jgi:dipeptidyl aminopeptidase/acylaminoacyl peptidase